MEQWNIQLFSLLNASEQASPLLLLVARWTAEWAIFLIVPGMVLAWWRGRTPIRAALLNAAVVAALALGINQMIGLVWYHPRPFELGIGQQFLAHGLEASFPSDHATVLWALGLALAADRTTRSWGIVVGLLGLAVAWSRIYLGVHFPFDMVGSLFVAVISLVIVRPLTPFIAGRLCPLVERLCERVPR